MDELDELLKAMAGDKTSENEGYFPPSKEDRGPKIYLIHYITLGDYVHMGFVEKAYWHYSKASQVCTELRQRAKRCVYQVIGIPVDMNEKMKIADLNDV